VAIEEKKLAEAKDIAEEEQQRREALERGRKLKLQTEASKDKAPIDSVVHTHLSSGVDAEF
jgi:hypothetical protein